MSNHNNIIRCIHNYVQGYIQYLRISVTIAEAIYRFSGSLLAFVRPQWFFRFIIWIPEAVKVFSDTAAYLQIRLSVGI
jgi:uncharacterized membrane protein